MFKHVDEKHSKRVRSQRELTTPPSMIIYNYDDIRYLLITAKKKHGDGFFFRIQQI